MATAKKPAVKKPAAKKPAAKKAVAKAPAAKPVTAKKPAARTVAAKSTTAPRKKASTKKQPAMKSFRLSREDRSFTDFRITRQTVYWVILVAFIIFVQLWILKLQVEVVTLLDAQQSTSQL